MLTRQDLPQLEGLSDHDLLLKIAQAFIDYKELEAEKFKQLRREMTAIWAVFSVFAIALAGMFLKHCLGG